MVRNRGLGNLSISRRAIRPHDWPDARRRGASVTEAGVGGGRLCPALRMVLPDRCQGPDFAGRSARFAICCAVPASNVTPWPGIRRSQVRAVRDGFSKQAIEETEAGATGLGSAQHLELMPQSNDFEDQPGAFAKSGSRRGRLQSQPSHHRLQATQRRLNLPRNYGRISFDKAQAYGCQSEPWFNSAHR